MKLGIFIATVVLFLSALFSISHIEEAAREAYEEGNYCDSLKGFKRTALFSKGSGRILGSFYARGLCVSQNIARAKEYYAPFYDNKSDLGKALFYDAIAATDADELIGKPIRSGEMAALLIEARALGFQPLEKDLAELRRRDFGHDIFYTESAKPKNSSKP